MIKLCGFRVSNYHNKVRLVLLERGIPFDEDCEVKPSQKDEYTAKSPMGKVPYLEVDGEILFTDGGGNLLGLDTEFGGDLPQDFLHSVTGTSAMERASLP